MQVTLSTNHEESSQELLCPVCEFNYIHLVKVSIAPVSGKQQVTVDHTGVYIEGSDMAQRVHGVQVDLEFACEQKHWFSHRLSFHKGVTTVTTKVGVDDDDSNRLIIWRD